MNAAISKMKSGHFWFFYQYIGPKIILLFALSFVTGVLDSLGISMFFPLMELLSGNGEAKPSFIAEYMTQFLAALGLTFSLTNIMVALLLFFVAKTIVLFISAYIKAKIRSKFIEAIRLNLIDSLGKFSYSQFTKMDTGSLSTSFTTEVGQSSTAFEKYLDSIYQLVIVSTYLFMALLVSFASASAIILLFTPIAFFYYFLNAKTKKYSFLFKDTNRLLLKNIVESIMFYKYLKASGLFIGFNTRLRQVVVKLEMLRFKMALYKGVVSSTRDFLIILSIIASFIIHSYFLGGDLQTVLFIIVIFYRGFGEVLKLQNSWQSFVAISGSLQGVRDTLTMLHEGQEKNGKVELIHDIEQISFHGVEYETGDTQIINGIDLEIRKNEMVAFVGESGSGKTTLVNLIIGLLQASKGEVFVNDKRLSDYSILSYKKRFGYITQEPVVFSGTFFENVSMHREKDQVSIAKFWEVCRLANLDKVINESPEKEDTLIGDFGSTLSGGQRQRLSIARELFRDPEILVLDEATSSLDSETEVIIQQNINSLAGKMTIIIIAHRLSTIKKVDRIYVINKGTLVQAGTMSELSRGGGFFEDMLLAQEISE